MDRKHLNNFERGLTKDHSCEVWSNSHQWFRRKCCLKIVDRRTSGRRRRRQRRRRRRRRRRRTVSDHNSSPWAFGSWWAKKIREMSRECHNHKPQRFPDTKRKGKPTNPNKHKSNKRTKSIRLALSSPGEVIAMLKELKNTRTKWHKVRHKTNRLVE